MSTLAETALSIGINSEKLPACPTLGKWYYLPALGKPKTNTACRARALAHGVVYLCNHVTGDTVTWFSDDLPQDPEALAKLKKQAEYAQYQAKRDQEKRYKKASIDAKNIITNYCTQANPNHPYLLAKGLKPTKHLYQQLNELVIPVYDSLSFFSPSIQSLQFIGVKGNKRFLRGGKMAYGCYWDGEKFDYPKIEAMNARNVPTYNGHDDIIISEGWATSQSLAQQWGVKGWHISAFNAGNLKKVALAIGKKYPRAAIIIAADNDQTGIKAAKEACFLVNGVLHMPEFTDHERETYKSATDWNDRYLIDKGLMPLQKKGAE